MKQTHTRRGFTQSCILKGFTLIELLVVVLIIGILAAVAVAQYQKAVKKAYYAGMLPVLETIVKAQKVYYLDHGEYTPDFTQLAISLPITGTSCHPSYFTQGSYKIGDYCAYLNSSENAFEVSIGMATDKWGLQGSAAQSSGYSYFLTSGTNTPPAEKFYCKEVQFYNNSRSDLHCSGRLLLNYLMGSSYFALE